MSATEPELGTYSGRGKVGKDEISYCICLRPRHIFWLDYTATDPVRTTSFHAEGKYAFVDKPEGGTALTLTVEMCPFGGGPKSGTVYSTEFLAASKEIICDGISCAKTAGADSELHTSGDGGAVIPPFSEMDIPPFEDTPAPTDWKKAKTPPDAKPAATAAPASTPAAAPAEAPPEAKTPPDAKPAATAAPASTPAAAPAEPPPEDAAPAATPAATAAPASTPTPVPVKTAGVAEPPPEAAAKTAGLAKKVEAPAPAKPTAPETQTPAPTSQGTPAGQTFTLEELKDTEGCRAKGVDPTNKEAFLSETDFLAAFGMARDDFAKLPKWKRDRQKKDLGIF